jgi:hypothetical protein
VVAGVETVLDVLETAGFERLPKPLVVAGSSFDFDAAARGTGASHDLVVVAVSPQAPRRLVRLLSGLSRTLDQAESRRPVSLVLLGELLDSSSSADLERHARVLTIESSDPGPEEVHRAVAVLLPLALPSASSQGRDPLAEVAETLGSSLSEDHQAFLEAARVGPDEVRETLRRYVEAAVNGAPDEQADS